MAVADSPVIQQYKRAKAQYPQAIVMFRMGDFYEILGDDAAIASDVLKITLTRRRTAQAGDEGIPMCGVPYHAAEGYIGKLLEANYKVALAEQTETPEQAKKARGSGALVNREVIRLYTPGTLTEESYLPAESSRLLVALYGSTETNRMEGALAWMDVSTGDVGVRSVTQGSLPMVLAGLSVGEGVTPPETETLFAQALTQNGADGRRLVSVHPGIFTPHAAQESLKRAYGLADIGGLGLPDEAAVRAVGGLIGYAELTQMGKLPRLKVPSLVASTARLSIDPRTRRNLELTESLAGRRADSLLGVLDACATSAGARLLARWVAEPLTDVAAIAARAEAVTLLVTHAEARTNLRNHLRETGDVARCVSRLLLGRGSPRDLGVLRSTGTVLPGLASTIQALAPKLPPLLAHHAAQLQGLGKLTAKLAEALADDPLPALIREGGFVRQGYDAELDHLRAMVTDSTGLLEALERKEAAASGMALKVKYNQVWGYYLEVTKAQLESAGQTPPAHWVHRQTTTQAHRYTTPELMALERDLGSAGAQAQRREEEILAELLEAVKAHSMALLDVSEALATLDVLANLAHVAARQTWVRPVVDASDAFDVENGKHPVVASKVGDFMPNGCNLTGGQLWLLTGPNMAGKSTFLRQNALILILAQMGSYVPATRAHIGVADAVFSRIGAADDLAAGQSTFMVEMVETAQILNRATPKSMVILDELGRGTATYDGLAIAWACVEDIATRLGCRTLFATHYHELTALEGTLPRVSCWQVAIKEWKGDIIFLHRVEKGAATGSYGVQVAKLAGVPAQVVARAAGLLEGFTKTSRGRGVMRVDELSLFAAPVAAMPETPQENPIEAKLKRVDVDSLTAREALNMLYELKGMA
jgi:DNA mismatch repair protein MutS